MRPSSLFLLIFARYGRPAGLALSGLLMALLLTTPAQAQNDGWDTSPPPPPVKKAAVKPKPKPATNDGWDTAPAKPAAKPSNSGFDTGFDTAPAPKPPAGKPKTGAAAGKPGVKTAAKPASKPAAPVSDGFGTDEKPAADDNGFATGPEPTPAPGASTGAKTKSGKPYVGYKLSTDVAVFPDDVRRLLDGVNKPATTKTAAMFQATWSADRFSAPQQQRIIGISQTMVGLRFKAHPHYEQYFGSLVRAVNELQLSGSAVDDLLTVFEKTLAYENPTAVQQVLATVFLTLDKRTLFAGRTNSLKMVGGSFAFQYYDGEHPAPTFGQVAEVPKSAEETPAPPAPKPVAAPEPVTTTPTTTAPKKKTVKKKPAPPANDGWDTGGWDTTPAPKKATAKAAPASDGFDTTPAPPVAKPKPDPDDIWNSPAVTGDWENAANSFDAPGAGAGRTSDITPYMVAEMPLIKGATLVLKDVDLVVQTPFDSVGTTIQKTTGVVMLDKGLFVGNGGVVRWTPIKEQGEATATLGQYQLALNKPGFKAEGATLSYPTMLEKDITGVFEYRAVRRDRRGQSSFPRFASFTNNARVKTLGEDIRYRGGFTLVGARLSTSALDGSTSSLVLLNDGAVRVRAQSRAFQLGDSLLTAERASVSLRQGAADSITHPGIKLKYGKKSHILTLVRGTGLYGATPYFDTYHQMEVGAELLRWDVRAPYVNLSMITAKNQVFARFASVDYFTNTQYEQQQGLASFQPLKLVYAYSKEKKKDSFYLLDLAQDRKIARPTLHQAMVGLARDGFIDYVGLTGEITLKPKVNHYVQAAAGKKDYDHLLINSLSSAGKNATLNLQTNELLVRGVERFNFAADTVEVYAQPDSGFVRVSKDRNIKFNGKLIVNDLRFVGSDFQFDYKGFYIDLNKIDSTVVRNRKPQKKGRRRGARSTDEPKGPQMVLTNRGQRTSGRLYLNRPDNRSGRRRLGAFPTFESQSPAFIAFNSPDVQGGAYDSTVYFEVPPFKLDSLNGSSKSTVGLKGTFHSGKIFPPFETVMKLQADGSTGFVHKAPPGGMPAYGGKGQFMNTLRMDGQGLQGEGELVVKGAKLKSDQFVFYLDSAVAVGKSVTIAASATAPKLEGENYLMKWFAEKDSLAMNSQQDPFKLYDGTTTLTGTAVATARGIGGNGLVENDLARIISPDVAFGPTSFKGRRAELQIKTEDPKKPVLRATGSSFTYNIAGGYADFAPEEDGKASTELTGVQYKTSLPGGHWDFKRKQVTMKATEGVGLNRSIFTSTKPDQLGLRWPAAAATYDLEKVQLRATGVPYITVADARVRPDSACVIVTRNASIQPFRKAVVTMDTVTHFHRLFDGQIQVVSRLKFTGSASYRYVGQGRDSTTLTFNDFRFDSASVLLGAPVSEATGKARKEKGKSGSGFVQAPGIVTKARATVSDKEEVLVAPRVQYRGGVAIISRKRGLINDGEGKLKFSKTLTASDWFAIRDSLDPNNLRFSIGGLKATDGTPLTTGIMRADETGKLYPLYVGVKANEQDLPIIEVGDELAYDKPKDLFTLGNQKRDGFEINEGNVMTYNGKNGGITWRGKMRFINGSGNFQLEASGIGAGIPDSTQYNVDAFITMDAIMPGKSLAIMGDNLLKETPQHPRAVQLAEPLTSKMGDFIGSAEVKKFNAVKPGTAPAPLFKVSPKFNRSFVINEVPLKWSRKNKAWYSAGPISISNILGVNVNASIEGFLEIKRTAEGDAVEFLIEANPETWYHFKYANNTVLTWSSSEAFNTEVATKQKDDYNVAQTYGVYAGDDFQKDQFRGFFIKQYRSEEERRKLKRKPGASAPPKAAATQDSFQADPNAAAETGKKKKKKDGDEVAPPNPDPANPPAGDADADTGRKKKKKNADEMAPPNPNFSADPPAEETDGKKKKKKKDKDNDDAFGEPTSP